MPETYRVTYQMRFGVLGWKYLFYKEGGSAKEVVLAASAKRTKLLQIHHWGVVLQSIHAANVDSKQRDHYKLSTEEDHQAAQNQSPDVGQTAALLTLFTAGNRSRKIWLRGLPDPFVETRVTGESAPVATWLRKVATWGRELATLQYQMQYIEPPDPGTAFEWKDVVSIEDEPNSNGAFTIVTCRTDHGLLADDQCTFSFDKKDLYLLGFRGTHTPVDIAVDNDTTKFVLPVRFRPKTTPYNPHRLRVRKVQYSYVALNGETDFIKFRSRDTGRAPGPRGRDQGVSFR